MKRCSISEEKNKHLIVCLLFGFSPHASGGQRRRWPIDARALPLHSLPGLEGFWDGIGKTRRHLSLQKKEKKNPVLK